MTTEIQRCYRALELEPGASPDQVKQAWRELVKVWHPDRFPNDVKLQRRAQERLQELNGAYGILEKYLTSGTLPPQIRPSSSASSEASRPENRERQETREERTEPPPLKPERQTASASEKSNAGLIWASCVGVVILLLIVANSGHISDPASSVRGTGFGSPAPAYVPPVSRALDKKNGFKDFKLGMTPQEAREILPPSQSTEQPGAKVVNFYYRATTANRIGDFSADLLNLSFFDGRLFRIALYFSSSQNEIFEAFKVNFGEPFDAENWKRGDELLRAKAWRGQNVSAAILSPLGKPWDSAIIYNAEAETKAHEYAAKEPERAARDFGPNGFKSLVMGMKLQEVTLDFNIVAVDGVPNTGVKKVHFNADGHGKEWQTIGFYPVTSVSAEFFRDKLYRVDLVFEENQKEIFKAFEQRFRPLQDNDTWTRGSNKLKAKSSGNDKFFATILAPLLADGNGDSWDAIVLLDVGLWNEAEQFKKDAPKRAAKDL
jgi:hypothetical protein